jgi:hypothetical protein
MAQPSLYLVIALTIILSWGSTKVWVDFSVLSFRYGMVKYADASWYTCH